MQYRHAQIHNETNNNINNNSDDDKEVWLN